MENRLEFADYCRDIFWQLMEKEGNNIEAVEARYVLEMLDFGLPEPLAYIKKQGPGSYYLRLCYDCEHTLYSGVVSIMEKRREKILRSVDLMAKHGMDMLMGKLI